MAAKRKVCMTGPSGSRSSRTPCAKQAASWSWASHRMISASSVTSAKNWSTDR